MMKRHTARIRGRCMAVLPLLLVSCTSCALVLRDTYHDPDMDFGLIKVVAVMPFDNLTGDRSAAVRVRDVFVTKLLATYGVYVIPTGEVVNAISQLGVVTPTNPTPEEVVKLAAKLKAEAVITGTLREYGEVRSGQTSANVISVSLQMMEAQTGKVVWTASSTQGGVDIFDRLFGGGGRPMNNITGTAVDDLIDELF